MKAKIVKTVRPDGTCQRFQIVSGFSWDDLNYFSCEIEPGTLKSLARLYKVYIIPKLKVSCISCVFFHVPNDVELPFPRETAFGLTYDADLLFKAVLEDELKKGSLKIEKGRLRANGRLARVVIESLEDKKMLETIEGEGDGIALVPVDEKLGFLSRKKASLCVNSHFFQMDPSDFDSPYGKAGSPYGLVLKNGLIISPPLNHRPSLLVDNKGKTQIKIVETRDLKFVIDGKEYEDGENCLLHFRPEERVVPKHEGSDIVISQSKVLAVKRGGGTPIPVSGFVLSVKGNPSVDSPEVKCLGLENFKFGSQVGPWMMKEGTMAESLNCPFFVKGKDSVAFGPTVYPLPFETARAGRICLGSDKRENPVIIWAEGPGKLGIDGENESTGVSLLEMAKFCRENRLWNAINLDGGGSAEIVCKGKVMLKRSDRMPVTNRQCERPVPNGLYVL